MKEDIDISVVERARAGDVESFARLYEMVYKDMYRMALYTLGDARDAEDVVAETALDAYTGIASLREPSAFKGWIFKILTNKCKKMLKGYIDKTIPLEEIKEEPYMDTIPLDDAEAVREMFYSLGETDRLIIAMHIFGGYRSEEIGSLLEMNPSTVRSRERRALGYLRKEMTEQGTLKAVSR